MAAGIIKRFLLIKGNTSSDAQVVAQHIAPPRAQSIQPNICVTDVYEIQMCDELD